MKTKFGFIWAAAILCGVSIAVSAPVMAQDAGEIEEIRREIAAMKQEYEQRIADLERKLADAEQAAEQKSVARSTPTAAEGSVTSGSSFNPQISVVLDGNYYHDSVDGEASEILQSALQPSQPAAHGHGHEHDDGTGNGFNIRSLELAFVATVDPYFDASAFLVLESNGELELEEAWFATRGLPGGLRLKAGQLLSEFGYHNTKHEHEWYFSDQNLAYLNLLGDHGLEDVGVQLTWLPDLPVYTLFGAELLQGDQPRVGAFVDDEEEREELGLGPREDGPRLATVFARVSPDLGYDHALRLGGSYVWAQQHQEAVHGDVEETGLEGDADLWQLEAIYKYDNPAAWGHHDFVLQAEYLRSMKDLEVRSGDPAAIGSSRKYTTDGLYVQGIYGVAPRWQLGLRYDVLGLTNKATGDVQQSFDSSDRWTGALTWTPTEFSRFRMQYSRSDILTENMTREDFETFWLQFLMTLGAHGAHRF